MVKLGGVLKQNISFLTCILLWNDNDVLFQSIQSSLYPVYHCWWRWWTSKTAAGKGWVGHHCCSGDGWCSLLYPLFGKDKSWKSICPWNSLEWRVFYTSVSTTEPFFEHFMMGSCGSWSPLLRIQNGSSFFLLSLILECIKWCFVSF